MGREPWMDRVVSDRMAVDQEFSQRVNESRFSSQQWGLIMTAAEFEIRDPERPGDARLVADTSKLPQIMPELERIDAQAQAPGAGGTPGSGGGSSSGSGGGVLASIKSALGLGKDGSGSNDEELRAAETLVEEYADRLQTRLEEQGKWASVCEQADTDSDG